MTYDAIGNLLAASDDYSSYTFTYDGLNRLETSNNAGTPGLPNVVLTYSYDAVGNLLSTTDNAGVAVTSTYDARNLLKSRTWQGGGIDPLRVEFDYDARGQRTDTRRYADATGTTLIGESAFAYDPRGLITGITHADGLGTTLVDYRYVRDAAGQITQWTHHGETIDFTHDAAGQLTGADYQSQTDEAYTYHLVVHDLTKSFIAESLSGEEGLEAAKVRIDVVWPHWDSAEL